MTQIENIKINTSSAETMTADDIDTLAAIALDDVHATMIINTDIEGGYEFNIKEFVEARDKARGEGSTIDTCVNVPSELSGTINVARGFTDVANALMAQYPNLHINVSTPCVRFKDYEVYRQLGLKTKSELNAITSATQSTVYLNGNPFVKSFNEMYYTKINSGNIGEICVNLEEVTLPNTNCLNGSRFQYCASLKKVRNFHNGITTIGANCLRGCLLLVDIYIPNVVTIGATAFSDSGSTPKNFYITSIDQWVNMSKDNTWINVGYHLYKMNGEKITSVNLSNTTEIKKGCFEYWLDIPTSIYAPNITTIGDYAFDNCQTLESITLGEIKNIPQYVFRNCYKLSNINIDFSKVEIIGNEAFRTCRELNINVEDLYFEKLKSMGTNSFYEGRISTVTKNVIFNGDTTMNKFSTPDRGSYRNTSIEKIIILDNSSVAQTLPSQAIEGFASLKVLDFPKNYNFPNNCMVRSNNPTNCVIVIRRQSVAGYLYTTTDANYKSIFVPANLVDTYKKTTGWTYFASKIFAIGGAEWVSEFGSSDPYADYPDQYKSLVTN